MNAFCYVNLLEWICEWSHAGVLYKVKAYLFIRLIIIRDLYSLHNMILRFAIVANIMLQNCCKIFVLPEFPMTNIGALLHSQLHLSRSRWKPHTLR